MNLFFIARNLPKERYPVVLAELSQMIEVYPQLDPETLWHRSTPCGTIFTVSMHTADQAAMPRRYVMQDDEKVVFYSGLPVNPKGDYPAHRAEALSAHWDQLTENLEGQYFMARATDDPPCLELQTDILGYEQVFYFHQDDLWLISNSVHLIERISKPRDLDPLGVCTFLSLGWVASDRTLRTDIRVIPGGQHWTWQQADIEPRRQSYYPPSRLARLPRQALSRSHVQQLADDLMQPLRSLGRSFDTLTCPLTGGRDSRLLAALLIRAGLTVRYYTFGESTGLDTQIATLIARTFNLQYEVLRTTASDVIRNWDKVCWQIVRQSDGMYPLQLITGVLAFQTREFDRLNIRFWGAGGEIARGFYNSPSFFLARHNVAGVQRFLTDKRIKKWGGLIRREGLELTRDYIHRFVVQCVDDGFAPIDIPDAFYTYQRVGRRAGCNMRASMSIRDSFSPYCTRPFIEATFGLPALQRYTEPLHYSLTRLLSPELHGLPFDSKPWRPQQPALNLLRSSVTSGLRNGHLRVQNMLRRLKQVERCTKTNMLGHLSSFRAKRDLTSAEHIVQDNMFDRLGWFEAKRDQIREICLDHNNSLIWSFVDRSMFDRITSSDTDSVHRSHYMQALYHIATLFYYEADNRRYADIAIAQPPLQTQKAVSKRIQLD